MPRTKFQRIGFTEKELAMLELASKAGRFADITAFIRFSVKHTLLLFYPEATINEYWRDFPLPSGVSEVNGETSEN